MPALLLLLLTANVGLAQPTPDAAVLAALAHHPDVAAAIAGRDALEQAASVGGSWGDPMLSVEYSNAPVDTWSIADHPMGGLQLRLQQTFPTSGAARLAGDVAEARVAEGDASVAEVQVQLEAAVRRAWWMLAQVRALRALTQDHVDATTALLDAVRARYEVGQATQSELLRLQVLRDRLTDDLGDTARDETALVGELGHATGQPGPFPTVDPIEPIPPDADVDAWIAQAADTRPALSELALRVAREQAEARLARARGLPDLTVWFGYRVRTFTSPTEPGTDFVSVGISAPLPVAGARRGAAEAGAALARSEATRARRDAMLLRLSTDLETAAAGWSRAYAKATFNAEQLLPAARQAVQATLADYRVGRADVAALYQAQVARIDLERAAVLAAVATHAHAATVGGLLGRTLVAEAAR